MSLESLIQSIVARASSNMAREIAHAVRQSIAADVGGRSAAPTTKGHANRPVAKPIKAKAKATGDKRRKGWSEADVEKALGYIKGTPGQRSEQIGKALGFDAKRMFKVLARLKKTKRVKVKGYGRGGTYTVGLGAAN